MKEHWIEDGTQGLHSCRVESYKDEPPSDPEALRQQTVQCKELLNVFLARCGNSARADIVSAYGREPDDPEVAFACSCYEVLLN